jgi:hypothetical protein
MFDASSPPLGNHSTTRSRLNGAARPGKLKFFDDANSTLAAIVELRAFEQWVGWRYKRIDLPGGGFKLTNPPVNVMRGGGASHSDPKSWTSFDNVRVKAEERGLMGIGFVLTEECGLIGIDLDHCFNVETGKLKPWAQAIIDLDETYAEISPSGEGLRIIARGTIDKAHKCDSAGVEIYFKQRYLTITANHIPGSPAHIAEAPATIAACLARIEEVAPRPTPGEGPQHVPLSEARNEPREVDTPQMYFTRRQRLEEEQARARGETVKGYGQPRESFFRNLNDKALTCLERWFPVMFPAAKFQPGAGGYRVESKDLGRDLQEALSATPEGIVDFGVADMGDANQGRRTPISLVMEWEGAPDPASAALWLCELIGVTPESLGWREKQKPHVDGADNPPHAKNAARPQNIQWRKPKPLPEGLLPVPAFDEAFLPPELAAWAKDITERMQCAFDFVGVAILVALGTLVGRKIGIRPQRKTDWIEVGNIWGFIVGRPGAMKSPAMNEALKPLNRLEANARKENEEALKEFKLAKKNSI